MERKCTSLRCGLDALVLAAGAAPQHSMVQCRLGIWRNAEHRSHSRAGAELFPMRLLMDCRDGSVRTCPRLGPCVLRWPVTQSLVSPCCSCSFLPAAAEPPGPGAGSPGLPTVHPGTESGMRVLGKAGGSPPKEREKLPPCFSCSSPSPTSVAGKGRVQPGSRLRPPAAGPGPASVRASKTQ